MSDKIIKVLLEMRPALEGYAGIPQEVRLLFRGLRTLDSVYVEGMLQTSNRRLAKGLPAKEPLWRKKLSTAQKYRKLSKVVISLTENSYLNVLDLIAEWLQKKADEFILRGGALTNLGKVRLTKFEAAGFDDFTWRTLFSRTLPASDFGLVAKANFRVNRVPWRMMHMVGLKNLNWSQKPLYPKLDTRDFDVFIGQTPYPARICKSTKMVIRYHDAIPVYMPHTIPEKSFHQATHFYALLSNVASGAWFACVSEATRQDLLRMFPEVRDRAVVIHNMVSHHYYEEDSAFDLVPGIVRSRYYGYDPYVRDSAWVPKFLSLCEQENFFSRNLPRKEEKYLLMVSTIEPRKNHLRLLAAWEVIRAEFDPNIKLIVVGTLGWDYEAILKAFKSWIDRGQLFMLSAVPAPDLRVLYRHAAATVCPSLGEGFDYSGVESMACGGITIASDIPVHREIYGDAAEYFDPYSTISLVNALKKVLYSPDAVRIRAQMQERGRVIAARYRPEHILPQWESFLRSISD
ncbi:glycosyltransferase family 4 protein [Tepidimonas charontis]|uniref:Glycosyltransferase n=1 Tax=Tepidimonas charontis TaxID=2267262 RepID=A0A554X5T1_9BURK|nr:glycosyltransferase family 1 protein [Tepidimonas charontis]TSE31183.1 glycosyltransferase [Tepidimonas charontis]